MTDERIVELAEAAAWEKHPTAREVDVYEDAPGYWEEGEWTPACWQVSVFDSEEHEGEWIYSVEIDGDSIELGMVS